MVHTQSKQVSGLAWFLLVRPSIALNAEEDGKELKKPNCGVYMAPSSIPGAGLGMYAGDKHYAVGDTVTLGDTVIPIFEYEWNNDGGDFDDKNFLWDEYTWNSHVFPGMEEEGDDPDIVMAASPGVGAAANSYLSLVNIEDSWIRLGRAVKGDSPGTGANTPYYDRKFFATIDIPEGGEIYVDYGTNYFSSRKGVYGYLPLPRTFRQTDILLKRYLQMKQRLKKRIGKEVSEELWADYYDIATSIGPVWQKSRVLNGLPDEEAIIEDLLKEGGSSQQHFNRSIRELSWLEENGQCMDNIKDGNSTNIDAGRGAFANRFIPQGGLVAPAPLVHIPNYNVFKVFSPKQADRKGKVDPDRDGPWFFQLLLNYCFGHEESTLLLCPYGLLTAFINHSAEKPNTRIQWSKEMRHPDWREKPLHEWEDEYHTGLQIDFVALRDIAEDEEILIDYGAAWEATWQQHVQGYVPRENYIPAFELNEMEEIDYKTTDDVEYQVYGVALVCRGYFIRRYLKKHEGNSECRVLKKLGDDKYRVQLMDWVHHEDAYMTFEPGHVLWSVPSDAFFFEDLPYTRDHYSVNAFRHAMMIPDDIFPQVWKNIAE